jgi:hypothetical protein
LAPRVRTNAGAGLAARMVRAIVRFSAERAA